MEDKATYKTIIEINEKKHLRGKGGLLLPAGLDLMEYDHIRAKLFDWFKEHNLSIEQAEEVLEVMKDDLKQQVCSGLRYFKCNG